MEMLTPWLESLAVAGIALFAFLLGRWSSRLPKPYWLVGYLLPLGLILLYCVAAFQPGVAMVPPLSWMTVGRSRFVCFNFVTTMVLSAPLARLPQRRTRMVVCALIVVLTAMSVVPFAAPAFNRSYLAGLKTRVDGDGVCRQSKDYTCGPAAAVTVLRRLGLPAEEGEIAILSYTSAITGTEPDVLAKALQKRYGDDGLVAEYRGFRTMDELRDAGLTVAVMKFNALQDHCVAILGVETNRVLVGDPLSGFGSCSIEDFEEKWLFVGIVLKWGAAGGKVAKHESGWDLVSSKDLSSPDSEWVATVFEMCSYDTTGYWPQVSLRRPGETLGRVGNVLSGGPGDGMAARWVSPTNLVVTYCVSSPRESYPPARTNLFGVAIELRRVSVVEFQAGENGAGVAR